jgi:L-iditol 2-dehydrogenase
MNTLLLTEPGQLTLTPLPIPEPGPGEIRLRVAACGICGSDVHGYTGESGRRIPPLVMGHEAAGTVDAVGKGVNDLAVGRRVAIDSTVFCGNCEQCRDGRENLCSHRQVLGVSCGDYRRHGCFAEYAIVPARVCYPIPDGLDFAVAALLEPLTIGLHAVNLGCQQGTPRSAVVVGCGMIGLVTVAALAARGVTRIAAIDIDAGRLAEAKRHGAVKTFNAGEPNAGAQAAAWGTSSADVDGADLVIEAVGNTAAVNTAIDAVTRGGTVVLVGNIAPTIDLPLQKIVTRQIRLQGSCASAGCYPEAIRLAAEGRVDLASFISQVAPLAEGPDWFTRLHNREPGLVKVVLTP